MPGWAQDAGVTAGIVVAVIAATAAVARLRPVRFVFRRLISDPLTCWVRAQVEHVVEPRFAVLEERTKELLPNGGSSMKDRVERIDGHTP